MGREQVSGCKRYKDRMILLRVLVCNAVGEEGLSNDCDHLTNTVDVIMLKRMEWEGRHGNPFAWGAMICQPVSELLAPHGFTTPHTIKWWLDALSWKRSYILQRQPEETLPP